MRESLNKTKYHSKYLSLFLCKFASKEVILSKLNNEKSTVDLMSSSTRCWSPVSFTYHVSYSNSGRFSPIMYCRPILQWVSFSSFAHQLSLLRVFTVWTDPFSNIFYNIFHSGYHLRINICIILRSRVDFLSVNEHSLYCGSLVSSDDYVTFRQYREHTILCHKDLPSRWYDVSSLCLRRWMCPLFCLFTRLVARASDWLMFRGHYDSKIAEQKIKIVILTALRVLLSVVC